mmetsp:Transcript_11278/g.31199  ORF Transcript_11278/g.31199 Transcript_11278/m.31199 type:complete len:382 (-) Transcript_11278:200-1345(-)|eukprot:CAMPEP_0198109128 /NCGR_PEP_ID=MMETSP1442-20131203/1136_1 /TAXON_ID= /ORGANISM="Craspedostauros australis, Strain CCMP3328" /LENGTH=381 /DNA_ID=CAMNT_0043764641 /DNA_START=194 /DNA_END=1339 /DNA_ORIENTATION=-
MSWFSAGLDALKDVGDKVASVTEKVKEAVPLDREMLAKLTLNTDDMKAERQQFRDDAQHKAQVKDMLAGMYPWETRDAEREILVEECKEAILALSSDDDSFFGPYEVPELKVVTTDAKKSRTDDDDEDGDDDSEDGEEGDDAVDGDEAASGDGDDGEDGDDDSKDDNEEDKEVNLHRLPTPESLEKLSKLEPLPPLLKDFDLDSHVGLIQKLLAIDPQLVKKQSTLSGGGARELVFWRNYFFNCAYTRYEAGLSIDEIWSFNPDEQQQQAQQDTAAVSGGAGADASAADAKTEEETVEFDINKTVQQDPTALGAAADAAAASDAANDNGTTDTIGVSSSTGSLAMSNEFEFVDDDDDMDAGAIVDPELDALEAEIARELED